MKYILSSFLILIAGVLFAQETPEEYTSSADGMDLQACIKYALENQYSVKNSVLDERASQMEVNETRGLGLPQIEGSMQTTRNIQVQSQFAPANALDPTAPEDIIVPLAFGLDWMNDAKLTANQLLIDPSYLLGLKAAKTYKDLAQKNTHQTKRDVVESVNKAYYTVLLNEVAVEVLESQKEVLEQLLKETSILYENGFNEKIDVQRVQVNLNNINIQLNNFYNNRDLSYILLKFQMNYPQQEELKIAGDLEAEYDKIAENALGEEPNYNQRIEYQIMQTQKELNVLNNKNDKAMLYPKLYAFGTMGANTGAFNAGDLVELDNYRGYGYVGLNLTVPIFKGLSQQYKVQQSKIDVAKAENQIKQLEYSIDYEFAEKKTKLKEKLESIDFQKENMELASEVYRVTNIKYKQGLVSNFETVSSKQDMTEAENSYYSALYETLLAYVEFKKANGTLYNEN